jgi:photoactive yellow protein
MQKDPRSDIGREQRVFELTTKDLVSQIEEMPLEALHELPFGVVRVDREGKVTFFSRTEASQSGFGDRVAVGRGFFTEIAPCMGTPTFLARIERAAAEGTLDVTFEHVGDFDDADREITIRVASGKGGGSWLFLQRHAPGNKPDIRPT